MYFLSCCIATFSYLPKVPRQRQCSRTFLFYIISRFLPQESTSAALHLLSRMGHKGGGEQSLFVCCFSAMKAANKQINNNNGPPLTAQLCNSQTEMAAACVIAPPVSHYIRTTTRNSTAAAAAVAKFDYTHDIFDCVLLYVSVCSMDQMCPSIRFQV